MRICDLVYHIKRAWWRVRCLFHQPRIIGYTETGMPVLSSLPPPLGPAGGARRYHRWAARFPGDPQAWMTYLESRDRLRNLE